jgi:hypothetical protein
VCRYRMQDRLYFDTRLFVCVSADGADSDKRVRESRFPALVLPGLARASVLRFG